MQLHPQTINFTNQKITLNQCANLKSQVLEIDPAEAWRRLLAGQDLFAEADAAAASADVPEAPAEPAETATAWAETGSFAANGESEEEEEEGELEMDRMARFCQRQIETWLKWNRSLDFGGCFIWQ